MIINNYVIDVINYKLNYFFLFFYFIFYINNLKKKTNFLKNLLFYSNLVYKNILIYYYYNVMIFDLRFYNDLSNYLFFKFNFKLNKLI